MIAWRGQDIWSANVRSPVNSGDNLWQITIHWHGLIHEFFVVVNFYLKLMIDSQEGIKMAEKMPIYPSSSFPQWSYPKTCARNQKLSLAWYNILDHSHFLGFTGLGVFIFFPLFSISLCIIICYLSWVQIYIANTTHKIKNFPITTKIKTNHSLTFTNRC
jgi:hypothetical protein